MPKVCDFPVFDADNHFYETRDSFTRHLPDRYKGAIDYVELRGRTKIMIRGTVSEYKAASAVSNESATEITASVANTHKLGASLGAYLNQPGALVISKAFTRAPIHRDAALDYLALRTLDADGTVVHATFNVSRYKDGIMDTFIGRARYQLLRQGAAGAVSDPAAAPALKVRTTCWLLLR